MLEVCWKCTRGTRRPRRKSQREPQTRHSDVSSVTGGTFPPQFPQGLGKPVAASTSTRLRGTGRRCLNFRKPQGHRPPLPQLPQGLGAPATTASTSARLRDIDRRYLNLRKAQGSCGKTDLKEMGGRGTSPRVTPPRRDIRREEELTHQSRRCNYRGSEVSLAGNPQDDPQPATTGVPWQPDT